MELKEFERLNRFASEPYPEQKTGWNHLVEHWKKQYDAGHLPDDLLAAELAQWQGELTEADAEMNKHHIGKSELAFAQIHARQARLTGRIKAIEEEQGRRRVAKMEKGS